MLVSDSNRHIKYAAFCKTLETIKQWNSWVPNWDTSQLCFSFFGNLALNFPNNVPANKTWTLNLIAWMFTSRCYSSYKCFTCPIARTMPTISRLLIKFPFRPVIGFRLAKPLPERFIAPRRIINWKPPCFIDKNRCRAIDFFRYKLMYVIKTV